MTTEELRAERARLIAIDPFADIINNFLNTPSQSELEIVFAQPGTTLDTGIKFVETQSVTPLKMYNRIYTMAVRGGWLKSDIWLKKQGDSVWMYKYDPKVVE